jgi:hypothetical protein
MEFVLSEILQSAQAPLLQSRSSNPIYKEAPHSLNFGEETKLLEGTDDSRFAN